MENPIYVIAKKLNGDEFTATTYGDVKVGEFHMVWAHDCNGLNFAATCKIIEIL